MDNLSEFYIPSAILAAALVEKSDLKGTELEKYAVNIQRLLIKQMIGFKQTLASDRS